MRNGPFLGSSALRNGVLASDLGALHLGHHGGHVSLQPAQPLERLLEVLLDGALPLQRGDVGPRGGSVVGSDTRDALVDGVEVALQARGHALGLLGGGAGGHGALQGSDFFEELLLLRGEVGDAAALARVEGLVGGFWFGGRGCGR